MAHHKKSRYLSCRVSPGMSDEIAAMAAEDGISKSRFVRGLLANLVAQRIEYRLILRLARPPRPCCPALSDRRDTPADD